MQFRDLKKQYEVLKPQMDKAILDTVGIIHPGVDCCLEGCPEVEDRRPRIGQH